MEKLLEVLAAAPLKAVHLAGILAVELQHVPLSTRL